MTFSRIARWNLILVSVLLLVLFFWIDPSGRSGNLFRFMARLHPAYVHFPIGFLLFGLAFELLKTIGWVKEGDTTINVALLLGSWAGVKAVLAGLVLVQLGGYPEETLFLHKIFGFAVTFGAAVMLVLRTADIGKSASWIGWAAIVLGLVVAGELGSKMTHGEGFSTEYAPEWVQSINPVPDPMTSRFDLAAPGETTVFDGIVLPILAQKCTSCHGAERGKGRLRLHSAEAIQNHSGDDPLIVAGEPSESLLIQRVSLPEGHEDQMPPPLRSKPISHADVELLKWWVSTGASFTTTVAETEMDAEIRLILEAYGLGEVRTGAFSIDIAEPDSSAISALAGEGISIRKVAVEEPWLEITCDDATCLERIGPIAANVFSLDLSGSSISDSDLANLDQLTHLTRLDLSETAIVGQGLEALTGLNYLEYLNLFGTDVNDEALSIIQQVPNIVAVYLWQTATTSEGIEALRQALPNATINVGD